MSKQQAETEPQFILWDRADGPVPKDASGEIRTSGLTGRIGPDNCYLSVYARNLRSEMGPVGRGCLFELEVGDKLTADFALSGSKGTYEIYRVS